MTSAPVPSPSPASVLVGQLRSKWPFLAALGAGCLVGASGLVLVQHLSRRVDLSATSGGHEVSKELTSLHVSIRDLQEAVRELKEASSKRPLKSALRTVTFSDVEESLCAKSLSPSNSASQMNSACSTASTEFFSAISSDEDEYFDLEEDGVSGGEEENASCSGSDAILELFRVVDDLCVGSEEDHIDALQLLREQEAELSQNSEFLWRLCKATYLSATIAGASGDNVKRHELISDAVRFGARAIKCNDDSSEAHKWYAIAVGSRGEYMGIKEKILDGFEFKRHVDRAAELAPKDHTIQHLLGRFCYEVAELSWWERKMASTLFAEPPVATMEEAQSHFLRAEEIKSDGWKENRLFLAKTFLKMQDNAKAMEWLEKAMELPVKNMDDEQAHEDVLELLQQYQSYKL